MISKNLTAFLTMISVSEGTFGKGDSGYNVLVGGKFFGSYATHPNISVYIPSINNYSTAAGRYQILHRYWVSYANLLKLPDFSPAAQDLIAIQMIKERNALTDIENGNIQDAITKCSNIWASLPGNNYGQHVNKISTLLIAFQSAGGALTQNTETNNA